MRLNSGDAVRLNVAVKPYRQTDVDDNDFWVAVQMDEYEIKSNKLEFPWAIFDAITGIYLGDCRKRVHDRRASRNVIRKLYHKFLFGTVEVMIEPQHVDVFVSFQEIMEASDD